MANREIFPENFPIEASIWVVAIAHGKRKPDYWKKRNLE
jgi:hypothetical protein